MKLNQIVDTERRSRAPCKAKGAGIVTNIHRFTSAKMATAHPPFPPLESAQSIGTLAARIGGPPAVNPAAGGGRRRAGFTPRLFVLLVLSAVFGAEQSLLLRGRKPVRRNAPGKTRTGLLVMATFLHSLAPSNRADAAVVYVADYTGGTIGEYDATTGAAINPNFVTGLTRPQGMALDSSGHLYVANSGAGTINEYNASTGAVIQAPLVTGLIAPDELALDGSGHLYVAQFQGNMIGEYNAVTGAAINASLVTGLNNPEGIVLDGLGNLYVANYSGNTIGEYNASTGAAVHASLVSTGLNNPQGLALDGSGHLYVANSSGNTMGEYNASTGAVILATFVAGLDNPTGLDLDGSGHLYVANYSTGTLGAGAIGEYNASTGAAINTALVAGLNGPAEIVYSPVPEPTATALLGGALLGLWAVSRARRGRNWSNPS